MVLAVSVGDGSVADDTLDTLLLGSEVVILRVVAGSEFGDDGSVLFGTISGTEKTGNCVIQDAIRVDKFGSFHHWLREQASSAALVVVIVVSKPEHCVATEQDVEHV